MGLADGRQRGAAALKKCRYTPPMKQSELRELIRNSGKYPVRICMDNGKIYKIAHEDFALGARDAVLLVSGPGHDFGAAYVICRFEHITRVEVLNSPRFRSGKA
jgi:hypothetical protein